jgi:hypothetical protein
MSTQQRDFATPERREFCRDPDQDAEFLKFYPAHYAADWAAATEWLGNRWRGKADCRHEYTDSRGSRTQREEQRT